MHQQYPKDVRIVFKNFPLRSHRFAVPAALAAGETPSPELVASTRSTRELRPRSVALLCLWIVGSIIAMAMVNGRTLQLPQRPSAELTVLAGEIATRQSLNDNMAVVPGERGIAPLHPVATLESAAHQLGAVSHPGSHRIVRCSPHIPGECRHRRR